MFSDAARGGLQPQVIDLNLDEIFEAYVIGKREEDGHVAQPGLERVA